MMFIANPSSSRLFSARPFELAPPACVVPVWSRAIVQAESPAAKPFGRLRGRIGAVLALAESASSLTS
jgi:hypothetical protein